MSNQNPSAAEQAAAEGASAGSRPDPPLHVLPVPHPIHGNNGGGIHLLPGNNNHDNETLNLPTINHNNHIHRIGSHASTQNASRLAGPTVSSSPYRTRGDGTVGSSGSGGGDGHRQSLTWSLVNPSGVIPPARSGAASVVVKGRLYMFGGYGGGTGRLDDFYSFSFESNAWEEVQVLSTEKPGCRENNGVVIGDSSRVYLFGGYNGNSWLNDLWMFDIDTQRWTCIQESSDPRPATEDVASAGNAPTHHHHPNNPLHHHNAILPHNGGSDTGSGTRTATSTVPSRRFGYVSVVHNNKFVLFGGFDGSRWLNDMYEFDFAIKTWREIHAHGQLPSVRSCPAWAKDDTHVYIQGGYDGVERKADFFACDLHTYTWTEMPSRGTPPSPRYFHSCYLYGKNLYAYGGYSGSQRLADMYAYDFDAQLWSQVDCTHGDRPSGRSSLVAQVYENSLYIFGGYNGETVLNDFYKFRLQPVRIPPPTLVRDLHRLVNHESLSDVTFWVEGKEFHANRAVLAVRSEYFYAMLFSGGMRESFVSGPPGVTMAGLGEKGCKSGSGTLPKNVIQLQDISAPVFEKVLEFLYTDTVREIPVHLGIPLLIVSERFLLDRLKGLCEDSIRTEICAENVIGIFIASHRHNADGLKDIALEFILKHLNDIAIVQGLSDLKSEPDLLVEIIRRNSVAQTAPQRDYSNSNSGPFGSSSEWSGTRR